MRRGIGREKPTAVILQKTHIKKQHHCWKTTYPDEVVRRNWWIRAPHKHISRFAGLWRLELPALSPSGAPNMRILRHSHIWSKDSILSRMTPRRTHRWVSPVAVPKALHSHGCLGGIGTDPFPAFFVCCAYPLGNAHKISTVLVISMRCDGVPR